MNLSTRCLSSHVVLVLLVSTPALAHHSFSAEFDGSEIGRLTENRRTSRRSLQPALMR
jgi:hypothetical protein